MRLADLTTLRVGGEARELLSPSTTEELVAAALDTWDSGEPWLALGGGSNLLVGDDGFDGTVIRVLTRGVEVVGDAAGAGAGAGADAVANSGTVLVRAHAGEPWDAVVAFTVERGLAGIEALSGIPGSAGAAPVQNIGAYGQELSESLESIEFLDERTGERMRIPAADLELGYRTSSLKRGRRGIVLSIDLRLRSGAEAGGAAPGGATASGHLAGDHVMVNHAALDPREPAAASALSAPSAPIAYDQLAAALGVAVGDTAPLAAVRAAVLRLRASKGMVLDSSDPDSVSAGSFFTNPIVDENFARGLPDAAPRWILDPDAPESPVKLSAAWLIERAGIRRGFALPGSRAAVSSKHTLALVNTGGATAEQVAELARFVQLRVLSEFGVRLQPEPQLVGLSL